MTAGGYVDACGFFPASSGTGDFVVSAAITGYQTPASAGAVNALVYSYRAESADKSQWEEGFGAYTVGSVTLARTTVTANNLGTTAKISFTVAPNVFITAMTADLQNAALLTSGTLPAARIVFAAQADQETSTSTTLPVNPAVQQFHPSAAKAWVKFTNNSINGAQTITASYNVSGVSRTAVGTFTVTFATAFSSANYAASVTNVANGVNNLWGQVNTVLAGSCVIAFLSSAAAAGDPPFGMAIFYGDQ